MMRKYLIAACGLMLLAGCSKTPAAQKPETTPNSENTPVSSPQSDREENTISGTISDIKNVMFILNDGKDSYVFPIDENQPLSMNGIQDGDSVTVTYTGTLSLTGDTEFIPIKVVKN